MTAAGRWCSAHGRVLTVMVAVAAAACGGGAPASSPSDAVRAPGATAGVAPALQSGGRALESTGPATGGTGLTPPANLDLSRAPAIPMVDGLVIVTAVVDEKGDYESVKRVSVEPGADRVRVSYSSTLPVAGVPTEVRGSRTLLARDLKTARTYRVRWLAGQNEVARGSTALGVSADVLDELRRDGRSECALASIDEAGTLLGAVGAGSPEYEGVFERVAAGPVPVPVIVDGERQWVPALHAKGRFEGLMGDIDAEFWFLDDPGNPLALRGVIASARFLVTRIDRPQAASSSRLERALMEDERVELPGVYFAFASAALRPESEGAIAEVAALLQRHPDWRLRFEGHTDNVGGAGANLDLSRARAEAVRAAVAARVSGGGDRLEAIGFGLARPRESNESPEGRASNRRVEIVRLR